MNTKSLLIIKPNSISGPTSIKRVAAQLGLEPDAIEPTFMSNMSILLDLDEPSEQSIHLFATGSSRFDHVVILSEFPNLFGNEFTLALLDRYLKMLRPCGDLRIELRNPKRNERLKLITQPMLRVRMTHCRIEALGGDWVRLVRVPNADNPVFSSIYPFLSDKLGTYINQISNVAALKDEEPEVQRRTALRLFIYGLFGANQKSFIIERILCDYGLGGPVTGLDMGGGIGFMAAEMACHGHMIDVVDCDLVKTKQIGPWLTKLCGVDNMVRFKTARIENIASLSGSYDFISFCNSLMYADRACVGAVLEHSIKILKPGGLIFIYELPKDASKPGVPDHDLKFRADELFDLLKRHAAPAQCYNMFTGLEVSSEDAAHSTILAVSRKPTVEKKWKWLQASS